MLKVVVSPTEDENALPIYADSVAEWKDFCGDAKSTIKSVLASSSAASPEVALRVILAVAQEGGPQVQAVHAGAPEAMVATAAQQLDVRSLSVLLHESTVW